MRINRNWQRDKAAEKLALNDYSLIRWKHYLNQSIPYQVWQGWGLSFCLQCKGFLVKGWGGGY